jgi:hypothetical protein
MIAKRLPAIKPSKPSTIVTLKKEIKQVKKVIQKEKIMPGKDAFEVKRFGKAFRLQVLPGIQHHSSPSPSPSSSPFPSKLLKNEKLPPLVPWNADHSKRSIAKPPVAPAAETQSLNREDSFPEPEKFFVTYELSDCTSKEIEVKEVSRKFDPKTESIKMMVESMDDESIRHPFYENMDGPDSEDDFIPPLIVEHQHRVQLPDSSLAVLNLDGHAPLSNLWWQMDAILCESFSGDQRSSSQGLDLPGFGLGCPLQGLVSLHSSISGWDTRLVSDLDQGLNWSIKLLDRY